MTATDSLQTQLVGIATSQADANIYQFPPQQAAKQLIDELDARERRWTEIAPFDQFTTALHPSALPAVEELDQDDDREFQWVGWRCIVTEKTAS